MKDNKYAPVIIPTLNRYEHFKRCLESLSRCTDADKTEVIIGLDYPPSDKYVSGYNKIKKYLERGVQGFRSVTVLETEHNLNAYGNAKRLWQYAFDNGYSAAIFTEDDNEFAPAFLSYCNWGLHEFADKKNIFYICGYSLVDIPELFNNVYAYNRGFCAWGCATWLDRRIKELECNDFTRIKDYVDEMSLSAIFEKSKVCLAASLLGMLKKRYILSDTALQIMPEDERWCIFPKNNLVRNWGQDGSGIHSGNTKKFNEIISKPLDLSYVFVPHIEGKLFTSTVSKAFMDAFPGKPFSTYVKSIVILLTYKLIGKIVDIKSPKLINLFRKR